MATCSRQLLIGVIAFFAAASSPFAQSRTSNERFLGLDLFGGAAYIGPNGDTVEAEQVHAGGWEAGVNARFLHWMGLVGSVARVKSKDDSNAIHQYLGGVRVNTDYGGLGSGYAHILVGGASVRTGDGSSETSPELVIGAGLDTFMFFRLELDYARLTGPRKNNVRALFGGVVPLCFSGCRSNLADGFDLRH